MKEKEVKLDDKIHCSGKLCEKKATRHHKNETLGTTFNVLFDLGSFQENLVTIREL